jgi:ADP-heptose:LPS heptosyltransferase
MNASTIKWIDRRIGVLLCRLLSAWSTLFPQPQFKATRKVVFIKLIEQGASVLAYSALKEAVEKLGKENVYFLVFAENRPILDFLNVLAAKNIIEVRNDGLLRFAGDMLKALIFLRKQKVDSSIDMEFFSRASAIIAYLSGAKKRVGLYSFTSEHPYRGSLVTHKIHYNPYIHVSSYYLSLLRALDEKAIKEPLLKNEREIYQTENPRIRVEDEVLEAVRKLLGKEQAGKRIVILNANASDMLPLRKWEMEKFGVLAGEILKMYSDVVLVFTGVEKERKAIEQLQSKLPQDKTLNLAGKTSLQELMGLYQLATLVITNDSGPAHFASMFDTSIIVLFGPETPALFAPLGDKVEVIYKELACSPCVNVFNHRFSPCTNNVCMQSIEVKEVVEKVKKVLL